MRCTATALVGITCAVPLVTSCFSVSYVPEARAIVPASNRFCETHSGQQDGRTGSCEDFSAVQDGKLPAGWIGGASLLVQPSKTLQGQRVLTNYQPQREYLITIPWRIDGDYRLEWLVRPCGTGDCEGLDARSLTVSIGNLDVTMESSNCKATLALGNTVVDMPDRCGLDASYHHFALERSGGVHKLFHNAKEVALARYDNLGSITGVAIRSTAQGFSLAGIRFGANAAGGGAQQPVVPSSCSRNCTDEEVCLRGSCQRLCPYTPGQQLPVKSGMTRSLDYVETRCDGGPCVFSFDNRGGAATDIVRTAEAMGCKQRAGMAFCCPSPTK
jgi:hypothetical protein